MEATTLTSGSSIVVKQYSHHPIHIQLPVLTLRVKNVNTNSFLKVVSGSSTVVEHLPHYPKVIGSSPAIAADTG
jgi:hypothetical protein